MLAIAGLAPPAAMADRQRLEADDIKIEVIGDQRDRPLPQYAVERGNRLYRGYLEARRGEEYAIRVHNRSDRLVGLVIAVDGRNIISGERSDLGSDERMYILAPHERREYRGWRTARDQVNRFYFTDAPDSYAGRWGDHSAMGVIAIAAYAEERSRILDIPKYRGADPRAAPAPDSGRIAPRHGRKSAEPGTGFGDEEWSPSRRVDFDPQSKPFARYFLKYEWRKTLCDKGVARCGPADYGRSQNRLWWDRDGFAPYPPGDERRRLWW
jgi:hypothetical protein